MRNQQAGPEQAEVAMAKRGEQGLKISDAAGFPAARDWSRRQSGKRRAFAAALLLLLVLPPGVPMAEIRHVQHCRWAQPTLFLTGPLWAASEEYPWSCNRDGKPRLLDDTHVCADCARWTSDEPTETDPGGPWRGWRVPVK
jgi:hypothetical protein